jgi:hypothetical protein
MTGLSAPRRGIIPRRINGEIPIKSYRWWGGDYRKVIVTNCLLIIILPYQTTDAVKNTVGGATLSCPFDLPIPGVDAVA